MLSGAGPLLIVGAGKMGGAMLDRWLELGLPASQVVVIDPLIDAERRAHLIGQGAKVVTRADEAAGCSCKVLLLAVKPQVMADALAAAAPLAGAETLILSIAAGQRLATLEAAFAPGQPVVRAMPNTPAQVGEGMSVAIANSSVGLAQRNLVDALLSAVGKSAWVEDESLIDAVTAVSGSGPAYVFLLAECLASAAKEAGLPDDIAALLARQTIVGAGALLAASPLAAGVLRQNVTSPKGTTAAALEVLMGEDGLQPLLTRAVAAAKRRSIELG